MKQDSAYERCRVGGANENKNIRKSEIQKIEQMPEPRADRQVACNIIVH
jgi:hypothetical protein